MPANLIIGCNSSIDLFLCFPFSKIGPLYRRNVILLTYNFFFFIPLVIAALLVIWDSCSRYSRPWVHDSLRPFKTPSFDALIQVALFFYVILWHRRFKVRNNDKLPIRRSIIRSILIFSKSRLFISHMQRSRVVYYATLAPQVESVGSRLVKASSTKNYLDHFHNLKTFVAWCAHRIYSFFYLCFITDILSINVTTFGHLSYATSLSPHFAFVALFLSDRALIIIIATTLSHNLTTRSYCH